MSKPTDTPERHRGRSVLITGGASGIGKAIALRFLDEGAQVTVLDQRAIDEELSQAGCHAIRGDAASESVVASAVGNVSTRTGSLDVMVCNAGVISIGPVVDMAFDEWKRVTSINIDSVFLGARAAAQAMIKQGRGGVIVNAASGAGRRGVANIAHYCASKAAVINLTQTLALELAAHRIRVNCYVPGHIETPFWQDIASGFSKVLNRPPEDVIAGFRESVPWGRFGTVNEVASTVCWLASDEAEYINGQAIAMNGAEFLY